MMSGEGFASPSHSSFTQDPITNPNPNSSNSAKRKRNLPGFPDPDAEVIALSPKSLMETNRFVCEICSKGFQRDQNLQLHRRGHNLPWKLKQRNKQEVVKKKVYICPEKTCVHHDPSRALGDLTGVKKHFSRKHGEKKWQCEKCSKRYAVQSDWKAHSKICGTKEYKCDCGTLFSRKDSFITHRAFCDALTEDNSRMASFAMAATTNLGFQNNSTTMMMMMNSTTSSSFLGSSSLNNNIINNGGMLSSEMMQWLYRSTQEASENVSGLPQGFSLKQEEDNTKGVVDQLNPLMYYNYGGGRPINQALPPDQPHMSATALLQKASQMESMRSSDQLMNISEFSGFNFNNLNQSENLIRDFLGVEGNERRASISILRQEVMKLNVCSSSIGFSGSE